MMSFECPLCNTNAVFADLKDLDQHIDSNHLNLPANEEENENIKTLELRIERLLGSHRKTWSKKRKPISSIAAESVQKVTGYSAYSRAVHREVSERRRESEFLRERCLLLEHQLNHNFRHYDLLVDEQIKLKSNIQSVHDGIRSLSGQQREAKREMELYVNGLIDRIRTSPDNSTKAPPPFATKAESIAADPKTHYSRDPKAPGTQNKTKCSEQHPAIKPRGTGYNLKKQNPKTTNRDGRSLTLIFRHLDSDDLLVCASVSKLWSKIASLPVFWRRISVSNKRMSLGVFSEISKRSLDAKAIILCDITDSKTSSSDGKKSKHPFKGSLDSGLAMVIGAMRGLKFLKIENCCPSISDRYILIPSPHFEAPARKKSHGPVLCALGFGCQRLESIILPPSHTPHSSSLKFDDNALTMIAKFWPKTLCHLSIHCRGVTIKGLLAIAKNCTKLESLELNGSFTINDEHARMLCRSGLQSMISLHLINITISAEGVRNFATKWSALKSLLVVLRPEDYSNQGITRKLDEQFVKHEVPEFSRGVESEC